MWEVTKKKRKKLRGITVRRDKGSNLYCFPPTGRSRYLLRRAGKHGVWNDGFFGWVGTEKASLEGEALYLSGRLCLYVYCLMDDV